MLTKMMPVSQVTSSKPQEPAALDAARKLFDAFAANGIRYCHWKSNLRLEHGLLGKTDLDLLVDPSQADMLRQILAEQNVKRVLAPAGKRYPGIEDYLGFDVATGKLFHLHVHYLLVLGEQFVKNYHIPLEEQFLSSTVRVGGWINIPAPELELSILSLRALLKYRDRDALKDLLSIRSSGLPGHILAELNWLREQTTEDEMRRVVSSLSDVLPANAILELLDTIARNPRDGRRLLRLRAEVRKSLRRYQRQDRARAVARYFQELWRRQVLRFFRPSRGMTLPEGGITITLIGADGSGKTTLTRKLKEWLGWRMDVHCYYLGSKQPSRLSAWLYMAFRMVRRSQQELGKRIGNTNAIMRVLASVRESFLFSHFLSIGNDRYRRFVRGREQASDGSIVIFDRFPYESPLDGPEIKRYEDGESGRLIGFFSQREQKIYDRFSRPDHMIILKVTPEVSQQRKPDHRLETIQDKDQAIKRLQADLQADAAQKWVTQNADIPLEDVLLQLKRKIWAVL